MTPSSDKEKMLSEMTRVTFRASKVNRTSWVAFLVVIEVIWNSFEVRRNKRYHGGYQIIGYTDGGRRLKLIVYEKEQNLIRVITGWDHDR